MKRLWNVTWLLRTAIAECGILAVVLLLGSGCFYGKVKTNPADRAVMPYQGNQMLVFRNQKGETDTLRFIRKKLRTSQVDFFIDRNFGHTSNRRRPYLESFGTDSQYDWEKKISVPDGPLNRYHPFYFTFYKESPDSLVQVLFGMNGRWNGSIRLDHPDAQTVQVNNRIYADVLVAKNERPNLFQVDRIFWSVHAGLIKITMKDGTEWDLVENRSKE